ncbi:PREDICTED: tetrapyrrole-binding protein, chloroplastic-like isoform X2 [Tarenaya hassleriana]|uniref:tetrapyrrole-binding protein, chloroplastic-like isoform X1 n=1 Tax=Tarenaya hassleriana TaxID=28532 RepID=UPI00053C94BB|nr:PREDICTED: tetrapyrrole-binding protein, chloroplastic-like isoform X1 [Tarenaya hassleriana]XP_019056732.1 PREDICTED: tetrapyrrole-binding protein, chloroplastic-like isoform X2 [Tarenaya hassleriana]
MATANSLRHRQSHHHHHDCDHHRRCLHSHSISRPTSLSFRQPTSSSSSAAAVFSLSSSAASPAASAPSAAEPEITFDVLEKDLSDKNFRQADEETRRLLIQLAGESAVKRGYVFFSEVQFISKEDLKAIDDLWTEHSEGRFGYSVQRRIWNKVNKDFTRFFIKVGWMKKLDTEVEQHNYRAFPNEFMWELNGETPEGHLPLTNALRGTQLLNCVLSHPAFAVADADEVGEGDEAKVEDNRNVAKKQTVSKRVFKPDYSF